MKIIPKGQNGLVVKSDNTRVVQQPIIFPIKYKLKPGETFVTDRNTGKKVLVKQKNEIVSDDKRNTYRKQQDQKNAQQIHKQYKENKNQEEGMKNLQGFFNLISPSTYIGPVFNNNGKSYLDNVISGEGTGNIAGNIAVDLLTPIKINLTSKLVNPKIKNFTGLLNNKKVNISKNLPIKYSIGDTYYENDFEEFIPLYKQIKNKPYFKKFDVPFIEDILSEHYYIPIGKIEPDNFSRYQAERIIQNMKRQRFNPDKSSSTLIRQIAKDPVTLYVSKQPTNVMGFNFHEKSYARLTPNTTEERLASIINHEGISHNTDGIIQGITRGVGSDQYSEITDALRRSKLYHLRASTNWQELRATITEFMRKMFNMHKHNSGTTYADVQDAVYKEIDDMPLELMSKRFESLNDYGRDYANYLRHYPSELNKFKELLKYGMGLGTPIGISTYKIEDNKQK